MSNGNDQINVEEIRSLIAKIELTNMRVVRELCEINRKIDSCKVNKTIIAKARVVHQGEGLYGINLHVGDHVDIINTKPGQQDSGEIQGTTPT